MSEMLVGEPTSGSVHQPYSMGVAMGEDAGLLRQSPSSSNSGSGGLEKALAAKLRPPAVREKRPNHS